MPNKDEVDKSLAFHYDYWGTLCLLCGVLAVLSGNEYGIISFLGGVFIWAVRDLLYPAR